MRSNRKHTATELEQYIHLYLNEGISFKELTKSFGLLLSQSIFNKKVLSYQEHGIQGLQSKSINNHYTTEFKKQIVLEHFQDGVPVSQLARKYNIPAHETVRNWVIKYTKGEESRSYSKKSEVYTMKSRKTTQAEKIEIVKDCLTNGLSYKETAEKYQVSYHNVYSWAQKYKKHGPDGLTDGRGHGKPDTIQTKEEKFQTEIVALKARNEYLEAENAALKKLDEVERELILRKQGMKRNTKRLRHLKKKDLK